MSVGYWDKPEPVPYYYECVHAYIACLRSIESISSFPLAWHFWSRAVAQLSLVRLGSFLLSPQQKALKPQLFLCAYASLVDCPSCSGGSRKNQDLLEICSTVLNNGRGPSSITHSNFAVLFLY